MMKGGWDSKDSQDLNFKLVKHESFLLRSLSDYNNCGIAVL